MLMTGKQQHSLRLQVGSRRWESTLGPEAWLRETMKSLWVMGRRSLMAQAHHGKGGSEDGLVGCLHAVHHHRHHHHLRHMSLLLLQAHRKRRKKRRRCMGDRAQGLQTRRSMVTALLRLQRHPPPPGRLVNGEATMKA